MNPTSPLTVLSSFNLSDHLPSYTLDQVAPLFYLSLLSSWTICYLVHLKQETRLLRMALWPVAVGANLWGVLTVDMRGKNNMFMTVGLLYFNATSAAVRWGLATSPPEYHPLPRKPFFYFIRETTAFKAFNLLINEARLISVVGHSQPLQRSSQGYLYSIGHHYVSLLINYLFLDLLTYPLFHLDPTNLGNTSSISANWDQGVQTLMEKTGAPYWVVIVGLVVTSWAGTYFGMAVMWHMGAVLGIASGVYIPEEYPKMMNKPWMSASVNEFWGRRYHQFLRHGFIAYSQPLSFLGCHFAMLRVFLASAIYHMLCLHPHFRSYGFWAHCQTFLLAGLGGELERRFYRLTGKRVGGWPGRIWATSWFFLCTVILAKGLAESGYLGGVRRAYEEDRTISVVEWGLYALGIRPHPAKALLES